MRCPATRRLTVEYPDPEYPDPQWAPPEVTTPIGGARYASTHLAGHVQGFGGDRARPQDPRTDGRDRPDDLDRHLRVRPAPVRRPGHVPGTGRRPRPRAH